MPSTYTLISSNVLSSSAASVTFSAIPSTYTDLVLRMSARSDAAGVWGDALNLQFNNDTTTKYSITTLEGNGSVAYSSRMSNDNRIRFISIDTAGNTSNTFTSLELYFPSYTAAQNKPSSISMAAENNTTEAYQGAWANLYRSTSAITEIKLFMISASSFVSGSSFYLYGIKNS